MEQAPAEVADAHPDTTLAAERLRDLQRLQAEYVNYKRRVDRDREVHRDVAVGSVIEAMLPVLDDIHLARQHGDLEGGPFAAIADKLEGVLSKFGVVRFGEPGEAFDPMHHEALMHVEAELADGHRRRRPSSRCCSPATGSASGSSARRVSPLPTRSSRRRR